MQLVLKEKHNYVFTAKELDPETNLYYYGARYYDASLSKWVSTDPPLARGDYLPKPGDFDTDHNYYYYSAHDATVKLKGHGGVFNPIYLDAYHYAGQNPVKLLDPDGNTMEGGEIKERKNTIENKMQDWARDSDTFKSAIATDYFFIKGYLSGGMPDTNRIDSSDPTAKAFERGVRVNKIREIIDFGRSILKAATNLGSKGIKKLSIKDDIK
jgi:RHS repeat-associated protein